jgi:hypothetical protein
MTPELKAKIKASMNEHLVSKGYPDISNDQIIQELPAMWKKLESEGLLEEPIKQGMTYQHFVNIALHKKHEFEIMEEVARHFRRRGP